MIVYKIRELMAKKEVAEKRRILLIDVAKEAEVNNSALSKMANPQFDYVTTTRVLDQLCTYFNCQIQDLIEHEKT